MQKEIKENLKQIDVFRELEDKDLELLSSICVPMKVKKGDIIIREGDKEKCMYIFVSGQVEITQSITLPIETEIGQEKIEAEKSITRLDAKNIGVLGEISLLIDVPRTATVKAITDCILFKIDGQEFFKVCEQNPLFGYKMMKLIARLLSQRLLKDNKSILKLTTALTIVLSKMKNK